MGLSLHTMFLSRLRAGLHQVKGCVATLVARVGFGTIRGRILIAFLMMSLITGALGVYATFGIARSGDFLEIAKTFDGSLMGINYARAAAADFANMRAAFARRWIATDPSVRDELDGKIDDLEKSLREDLEIAAARSQSQRAAKAASRVKGAVKSWSKTRQQLLDPREGISWDTMDYFSDMVNEQIDLLVNYTAGDGFLYRQTARDAVASDIRVNLAGTAAAVLLSALLALLLARRIIGPVAAASNAATRIAKGNLDGEIEQGGADELGALLSAMQVMRNNIAAMMQREVEQRRSAQARLADALESSREGLVLIDAEGRIALANSQAAEVPRQLARAACVLAPWSTGSSRPWPRIGLGGSCVVVAVGRPSSPADEARLPDGRWLRVSRSSTQEGGYIAVWSDISVLKEQEAKLKAINMSLDAALANMSQGLCLYDSDNTLKVFNRRFCDIFRPASQAVRGARA